MNKYFNPTTILLMICVALVLTLPATALANEEDDGTQVVKVGYLEMPGFLEGSATEYKTGSGYEYLQKVADYAGWEYEYVYGDFQHLMSMLESGEIDLLSNISYTDERAQLISYGSHEQGRESFYLYIKGESSGIKAEDYSTINGKRIGAGAGYYQESLWKQWCANNGIDCQVVEFPSNQKLQEALNNGTVDAAIGSLIPNRDEATTDWQSVFSFGDAPYYFCVSKSKPQLLAQLNAAQGEILSDDPYYNEKLIARYMPNGMLARRQMTSSEEAWLAAHGGPLKVGCLDNYLPLCDKDDEGNMQGVIPDLLSAIEENFQSQGLDFDLVVYGNYRQMITDLKNGVIDIAAPVYCDYWTAEIEQVSLTNSFLSTTMLLLKNGSGGNDVKTIGVDKQSPVQSIYAQIYLPDCTTIMYSSESEVAQAVKQGEVDGALSAACCYHVNAILDKNIGQLSRSTMTNTVDLSMAVSKDNPELLSLLDRGISTVSDAAINNSLTINSNVSARVTLGDYVAANPVMAAVICICSAILIALIVWILRRANRKARTDAMTGLLNKASMSKQVKGEINRGGVLFVIDVDDFKAINDTLGHEAGDKVLEHFSEELRNIFRDGDFISRFGGDEFTVFLPTTAIDGDIIQKKVAAMQKAIASCNAIIESNGSVKGSVSVGVFVVSPGTNISYADAFNKADEALYQAKQGGKAAFVIAE